MRKITKISARVDEVNFIIEGTKIVPIENLLKVWEGRPVEISFKCEDGIVKGGMILSQFLHTGHLTGTLLIEYEEREEIE